MSILTEFIFQEEVWDVSAQLIGLGLGILVLSTPGLVNSYPVLASTWMTMRLLHLWLRYQSLSVLQFNTVNLKRARILVNMHVSSSTVLGCEECNKMENILSWEIFSVPRIVFGVSLSDMLDGDTSGLKVKKLLELYSKEKYILVLNQQPFKDFEVLVSFKACILHYPFSFVLPYNFWLINISMKPLFLLHISLYPDHFQPVLTKVLG
ncbi:putative Root UVB sensitive family [Helianthus annuus]|nr:putative Root UVB sensitive family [Helianthus annuus]